MSVRVPSVTRPIPNPQVLSSHQQRTPEQYKSRFEIDQSMIEPMVAGLRQVTDRFSQDPHPPSRSLANRLAKIKYILRGEAPIQESIDIANEIIDKDGKILKTIYDDNNIIE